VALDTPGSPQMLGQQRWVRAVDLHLSGGTRQTSGICLNIRLAAWALAASAQAAYQRESGESLWIREAVYEVGTRFRAANPVSRNASVTST
jgi:hypothetical protein